MCRLYPALALAAVLLVAACAEEPLSQSPGFAVAGLTIRLEDQCDAASFNAVLGEGTCSNPHPGGITFSRFTSLLSQTGSVGSWRITPALFSVAAGTTIPVTNSGFEDHTYTEVAEFGGGIVPVLNQLIGETEVAAECLSLGASDFLAPGETHDHQFAAEAAGEEEKYMCCIHPWMRQTVRVR